MCGFYLHGSSYRWEEDKWEHRADVMKVNSHGELPNRLEVLVAREVKTLQNLKFGDRIPAEAVDHKVSDMRCDWGIEPWSGKFKVQRIPFSPTLFVTMGTTTFISLASPSESNDEAVIKEYKLDTTEIERDFMLNTRKGFEEWCREHWGKRGDEREFLDLSPRCLNFDHLKSELPLLNRVKDTRAVALRKAIESANNPRDRFLAMFHDAPNEYWAAKAEV